MNMVQQPLFDTFLNALVRKYAGLLLVYDGKILNAVYMLQLTGLSSVKSRTPGRLGPWALCYFATTSVIAVLTGIVIVVLIQPGRTPRVTAAPSSGERKPMPTVDAFLDLIRYPSKRSLISSCCFKLENVVL